MNSLTAETLPQNHQTLHWCVALAVATVEATEAAAAVASRLLPRRKQLLRPVEFYILTAIVLLP